MEAVRSAPEGGRASAAALEPARIALFSLGNLAAHRECGEALAALGVREMLARLVASPPDEVRHCLLLSATVQETCCILASPAGQIVSRRWWCALGRGAA